jgi:hypothetical protein
VWVGRDGWHLLRDEKALVLMNGKWYNAEGEIVESNI